MPAARPETCSLRRPLRRTPPPLPRRPRGRRRPPPFPPARHDGSGPGDRPGQVQGPAAHRTRRQVNGAPRSVPGRRPGGPNLPGFFRQFCGPGVVGRDPTTFSPEPLQGAHDMARCHGTLVVHEDGTPIWCSDEPAEARGAPTTPSSSTGRSCVPGGVSLGCPDCAGSGELVGAAPWRGPWWAWLIDVGSAMDAWPTSAESAGVARRGAGQGGRSSRCWRRACGRA